MSFDIGHIAVTTALAAASASLTSFFITYIKYKVADVGMTLNGALAGLVVITAGCANVSPLGAIIIGFISGILVVFSVTFFDKLKIDDPVGAISVHGICGAVGTWL
jgi:ammonium transporter, Amt family